MAGNKRKTIKHKDNVKTVRKDVKRRWRNKKVQEKALKNATDLKPAGLINNQKPKHDLDIKQACEHRKEKPACPKHRDKSSDVKEINQVKIVCTEKSQGCGTLNICYHAYCRSVLVAVMEFRMSSNKSREKLSVNYIKKQGWLTI